MDDKNDIFNNDNDGYKEILKDLKVIKSLYLSSEKSKKANSISFDFFYKVRGGQFGVYDIVTQLKELSNNYDIELLNSLLQDLILYLFIEKEEFESQFSSEEINIAVQSRKENNLEVPYTKPSKGNGKLSIKIEPSLDLEKLLYPFEFKPLYDLEAKIKSILNDQNPSGKYDLDSQEKEDTSTNDIETDIFKNNGLELFKLLDVRFDLKPRSRADLRFIYEKMKTLDYIGTTVKIVDFECWVNSYKGNNKAWTKEIKIANRGVDELKKDQGRINTFYLAMEDFKKLSH